MGHSTRKERDKMAIRLALEFLTGEADDFTQDEIIEGLRFALIGGEAPPWWAEVRHDLLAANREHREEVRDERVRCEACGGRGWHEVSTEAIT